MNNTQLLIINSVDQAQTFGYVLIPFSHEKRESERSRVQSPTNALYVISIQLNL